jgi:hypothetical protein
MDSLSLNDIRGNVRAHRVTESDHWDPVTPFKHNLVLYQWAEITSRLLTTGDSRYRLGGMYLEYQNGGGPCPTLTAPEFARDRTIEYYNNLAGSPHLDYLRVPMTAIQVLSSGDGLSQNQLVCFARSGGLVGVHGKPFSYAANSVIYGAALVAFVAPNDATQDLLFSCFYFDPEDQQPKLATSQVGLEWQITLQ